MKIDNKIEVSIPSKLENVSVVCDAVASFVRKRYIKNTDILSDIRTIISEAVTNSIVHGYKEVSGVVKVTAKLIGKQLIIEVYDRGTGIIDIKQAQMPLYTTGDASCSGMGFTIMKAFSDSLKVTSRPYYWTKVVMTKNLH